MIRERQCKGRRINLDPSLDEDASSKGLQHTNMNVGVKLRLIRKEQRETLYLWVGYR